MNTLAQNSELPVIIEGRREKAPALAPQALAYHQHALWIGSRDLRRIYRVDPDHWTVLAEIEPPGIPWAAASAGESIWWTLGVGEEDDRYLQEYRPDVGFVETTRIACPEFTGSYLSYDGEHLHLSQWYRHRILKLDASGKVLRTYDIGAEICGQVWFDGFIYVLRGTEQAGENWTIARFDPRATTIEIQDLARVPFACRSLAHDGANFWTNHRAANETVCFQLPA